jgi:hypothetical protein
VPNDFDILIIYQSQAVSLSPDGHLDMPDWLGALGMSHLLSLNRIKDFDM